VFEAMQKAAKRLPVTVQVTLEATGTMLLGTEIGAALTALEPFDVDIIGLNCATGPVEMNDAIRFLGANSSKDVSVLPNAGLPQNDGGRAVYKLTPEELATYHKHFVQDYGVRIVGGCCGTTPEHLKAVVSTVAGIEPAKREVKPTAAASSAYTSVPLDLDPKPLIVAEEMNTTTRVEHFRNLVRGQKYDDILTLAKRLVNDGSHMLDLCCAIVGEDEKGYITSILEKIATRVPAPILVDSTEADVVEEALKRIPGKAIINSINLEDGEKRTSKVLPMAKRYGAGVIALTIDEDGMALSADKLPLQNASSISPRRSTGSVRLISFSTRLPCPSQPVRKNIARQESRHLTPLNGSRKNCRKLRRFSASAIFPSASIFIRDASSIAFSCTKR